MLKNHKPFHFNKIEQGPQNFLIEGKERIIRRNTEYSLR